MRQKSQVWGRIAELWQGLFLRVEPHLGDIFQAGAVWQDAQTGWCFNIEKAPTSDKLWLLKGAGL